MLLKSNNKCIFMEKVWKKLLERLNGPILNENTAAALWPPCSLHLREQRAVAQNIWQDRTGWLSPVRDECRYKTNNFQLNGRLLSLHWESLLTTWIQTMPVRRCLSVWVKWTCLHFHLSSNIQALTFDLLPPPPSHLIMGVSFTTNISCVSGYSNMYLLRGQH